jgi:hypothetical protein
LSRALPTLPISGVQALSILLSHYVQAGSIACGSMVDEVVLLMMMQRT